MNASERATLDIDDLVHSYYAAVVRLCLSILDQGASPNAATDAGDEAEDAAQETFIAAAKALEAYRGQASPKTWLFSIAINTCRMRLRRRKARQALTQTLGAFQRLFGTVEDPQQQAESAERDRALWAAVDALDEKHRLAVILRYVHDLPVSEIAVVLGVNEGTVHSRLHYARQHLAGQLKRSAVFQEAVIP